MPDGFALTTGAFDAFWAANGFGPDTNQKDMVAAPVPDDVIDSLVAVVDGLGDVP